MRVTPSQPGLRHGFRPPGSAWLIRGSPSDGGGSHLSTPLPCTCLHSPDGRGVLYQSTALWGQRFPTSRKSAAPHLKVPLRNKLAAGGQQVLPELLESLGQRVEPCRHRLRRTGVPCSRRGREGKDRNSQRPGSSWSPTFQRHTAASPTHVSGPPLQRNARRRTERWRICTCSSTGRRSLRPRGNLAACCTLFRRIHVWRGRAAPHDHACLLRLRVPGRLHGVAHVQAVECLLF